MNAVEFAIQVALAEKLDAMGVLWAASQNGMRSNPIHVKNAKRAGLKNGHPDIAIYEPRVIGGRHYCGLFIELKTKKGQPSKNQIRWIGDLEHRGFKAVFAYGLDDATKKIEEYFKCKLTDF